MLNKQKSKQLETIDYYYRHSESVSLIHTIQTTIKVISFGIVCYCVSMIIKTTTLTDSFEQYADLVVGVVVVHLLYSISASVPSNANCVQSNNSFALSGIVRYNTFKTSVGWDNNQHIFNLNVFKRNCSNGVFFVQLTLHYSTMRCIDSITMNNTLHDGIGNIIWYTVRLWSNYKVHCLVVEIYCTKTQMCF